MALAISNRERLRNAFLTSGEAARSRQGNWRWDSPDAVLSVFRVPKELAGIRCDVFMSTQLKNTSRTRAKEIVRFAAHHLDGGKKK